MGDFHFTVLFVTFSILMNYQENLYALNIIKIIVYEVTKKVNILKIF